jgi:hypothetical protein
LSTVVGHAIIVRNLPDLEVVQRASLTGEETNVLWIGFGAIVMALSITALVFSGAGDSPFSYSQYLVVGAVFFATGMIVETIKAAERTILGALRPPRDEKETREWRA